MSKNNLFINDPKAEEIISKVKFNFEDLKQSKWLSTVSYTHLDVYKRQGKYSGTNILTAKIKCGECGSSYGAKVWHSNDKYRRIRCV